MHGVQRLSPTAASTGFCGGKLSVETITKMWKGEGRGGEVHCLVAAVAHSLHHSCIKKYLHAASLHSHP